MPPCHLTQICVWPVCLLVQVHTSAVFCAPSIGQLLQATSLLGLCCFGQWECWQGLEGGRRLRPVYLLFHPVVGLSNALAAFLDYLAFSIKCPVPHSLFVSRFQLSPCPFRLVGTNRDHWQQLCIVLWGSPPPAHSTVDRPFIKLLLGY